MIESQMWVDKFQPQTINECFLPAATKKELQGVIETGEVPSMFFAGPSGIGKTTAAIAICKELDLEYMLINSSLSGNIELMRTDIQSFASTISFNGKRKVIILDEADGLTAAAQASLRGVINEFVNNASFILTANFRNKIIEPLISRLNEVNFLFQNSERKDLAVGLFKFIIDRLEEESVSFEQGAVQHFVKNSILRTTDIRKILINAQKIAKTGTFNMMSIINIEAERLKDLIPMINTNDFNSIRTWVGENSDIEFGELVTYVYNNMHQLRNPNLPMIVSIINQHQYQYAFVIDKEINTVSMLAEISQSL